MNRTETGKMIAQLRKEAGYTQKSLAEALFVTDKAVSKWERGLCQPDSALLPKLSMLLDADIEYLIAGRRPYGEHRWTGEIRVEDVTGTLAGKPLLHYLLSYFMLVGITDICLRTTRREYVRGLHPEQYGLRIRFTPADSDRVMLLTEPVLLFGQSLTRSFQNCLNCERSARLELGVRPVPILFSHHPDFSPEWHRQNCERKLLGRGMLMFPLQTPEQRRDAEAFVNLYEAYHETQIADLAELARLRGLA